MDVDVDVDVGYDGRISDRSRESKRQATCRSSHGAIGSGREWII